MKNSSKHYLLWIAALFVVFTIGIFVGRIYNPSITVDPIGTTSDIGITKDSYDLTDTRPYIDGRININAATAEDLMILPGIGETIAQRIIDYRTENGPFKSVVELTNVRGMGDSNFNKIKDYLTVGG